MIHSWWMRERLQSYLDGELPEERRAALAAHLEQCVPCASSLHRMTVCDQLLVTHRPAPGALSPAASLALLERAMAEARAGRHRPGRGPTLLAWGFAALLAIAASRTAAWWTRPDTAALRAAANAPGGTNRQPEGVHRPIRTVFGGDTLMAGADPGASEKPPAKPQGGKRDPAVPKPPSGARRPALPPNEPRVPRSSSLRHRLIADAHSSTSPLLAAWKPFDTGSAGPVEMRFASPGSDLPAVEGSERFRKTTNDGWCEREAVRLVNAALDGDAGAVNRVVEALAGDGENGPDADVLRPDRAEVADLPGGPETLLAEWPQPWEGDEPQNGGAEAPLAEPQLLVMVSTEPAHSPVTVTEAPADAPGYSRVIACRPDASGRDTWLQATASTEEKRTRTALVLLGEEVWEW